MTIDYGQFDRGQGVNYWSFDPAIRAEVERKYPADARDRGVTRLEAFGELVGVTVAANADVVDANGPALHTYDRDGDVYTAALLVAEAQGELKAGDGRQALVARRFVDRALLDQRARGIARGDRLHLEWFDAIVRFAPVEPADLEGTAMVAD